MKKILISTSSFNVQSQYKSIHYLENCGFSIVTNPFGRKCTIEEIGMLLDENVVGLVAGLETLNRDVLMSARNLRVISRCGIGIDNIDLATAQEYSIEIYNTPSAPVTSVAELTIGLMLNLLRHISRNDSLVRLGSWKPMMGRLLSKQIVGVIGYGRIGKEVVSLLTALGAKVLIYDPFVAESHSGMDFKEFLQNCDLVSLHLPGSPENFHFFDENKLSMMKKGSFLINTSRGGIVHEAALYNKILDGYLAGAALDVFENEPYAGPLCDLPNVILTSHIGSYAYEARLQMETEAIENLLQGLKNKAVL